MKMLAKRPDERYQTAGELLNDLERGNVPGRDGLIACEPHPSVWQLRFSADVEGCDFGAALQRTIRSSAAIISKSSIMLPIRSASRSTLTQFASHRTVRRNSTKSGPILRAACRAMC
jgi:hypothetical protein